MFQLRAVATNPKCFSMKVCESLSAFTPLAAHTNAVLSTILNTSGLKSSISNAVTLSLAGDSDRKIARYFDPSVAGCANGFTFKTARTSASLRMITGTSTPNSASISSCTCAVSSFSVPGLVVMMLPLCPMLLRLQSRQLVTIVLTLAWGRGCTCQH